LIVAQAIASTIDRFMCSLNASMTDVPRQLAALFDGIAFDVTCAPRYFVDKLLSFGLHTPQASAWRSRLDARVQMGSLVFRVLTLCRPLISMKQAKCCEDKFAARFVAG